MWKVVTAMYEWTLSISLTIVFAFWFIEIPAMGMRGDFYELGWLDWIALMETHSVPILVCFTEWKFSSIPIGWIRYPFYVLTAIIYIVMLILEE